LKYKLVFKDPKRGRKLASIEFISGDLHSAEAYGEAVTTELAGELWQGSTLLATLGPANASIEA